MKLCVLRVVCSVLAAAFFLPRFAFAVDETDQFCKYFRNIKDESNEVRGNKVDPLTVFLGVDVRCTEKKVEYGQAITVASDNLHRGWQKRLEKNWSIAYCKPGSFSSEAIRNGWTISSIVKTTDGKEFRVQAMCYDAVAIGDSSEDSEGPVSD